MSRSHFTFGNITRYTEPEAFHHATAAGGLALTVRHRARQWGDDGNKLQYGNIPEATLSPSATTPQHAEALCQGLRYTIMGGGNQA